MNTKTKTLLAKAASINTLLKMPTVPFTSDADGKLTMCVGHYHISAAYGGYALCQTVSESGGTRDVLGTGHVPARKLQELVDAFIAGVAAGKAPNPEGGPNN
jgi:hypothetical protein